MVRKRWNIQKIKPQAEQAGQRYCLSPVMAQILLNRGVDESEFQSFLYPSLHNLCKPQLLPDIEKAAQRILDAVKRKEKILVAGDYDVDGVTALAIFHEFIKDYPLTFSFYIPHRSIEGYGLNKRAVQAAHKNGARLIIAFDCGTNAVEEIRLARELGIDVIVVDHHHPQDDFTEPFAFVNPKRKDARYPFSDLSAGALSFKLLQVLKGTFCEEALDLVALSVICDVVPLKGENRIFVLEGIKQIRKTTRSSIRALCKVSSVRQENIDTFHIGYILGPRINASGRVAHANDSLQMFLSKSEEDAVVIAEKLVGYNKLRKDIESQILKEAQDSVEKSFTDDYAIVVANEGWHHGVLGIVASRLADKYYRPAFVISLDEQFGRGSARSIHSVDLVQVLEKCSDSLLVYGGHKKAAGIQISKDGLQQFKERLNAVLKECVALSDLVPLFEIDAEIKFEDISTAFLEQLELLKPFGEANPAPLFVSRDIMKKTPFQKIGNSGYSVWLNDAYRTFEGVIYDKGLLDIMNFADKCDMVYAIEKNAYHNVPKLIIKDCRLSSGES